MPKTAFDADVAIGTTAPSGTHMPPTQRLLWLLGPALVAGVAYLDPGNVAANMSAGTQYGYLIVQMDPGLENIGVGSEPVGSCQPSVR